MKKFSKYISDIGNYLLIKFDYYFKYITKHTNNDDIETLPLNLDLTDY
jgi:hypothetical protein